LILVSGGRETATGHRSFRTLIPPSDRALVRTYRQCSGGLGGITWPDGGPILNQPVKLVDAFGVIAGALERFKKRGP
jgi:hypothetical protein